MVSRPLKKQQSTPIKIGDVVTFIYHSQRVHGIARFIGQTDFSANTLCGVALSEDVGKHNGTVKGRKYFVCPDKHGVFVPLRKVSLTPPALHDLIKKRLRSTNKEESEEKEEPKRRKRRKVMKTKQFLDDEGFMGESTLICISFQRICFKISILSN